MEDIIEAVDDCEKDAETKGVILGTKNKKIFCAGLELAELYKKDEAYLGKFWWTLQEMWLRLYSCPLPVVAACTGHAPAGGAILLSCSDYRKAIEQFMA
jgi:3,2-trans-enoyl-CoA isomerase